MSSRVVFYIGILFITITSFFYYPKFNKGGSEATISWDTSGYYWYLPSLFIYHDIKDQKFAPEIMKKYAPTPEVQQFFKHSNGKYVMKYSSGMALQYLPFFFTAHLLAENLGFEADGFSLPYQFALQFGGLIMCFIGLYFTRKNLLFYFSDFVTALVLICIVFATNYLNYAAIDNAMTHNWLFTWYAVLIYCSIEFYKKTSVKYAIFIGISIGISALTRPTDLVAILIPVFWGMNNISLNSMKDRINFLFREKKSLITAVLFTFLIGSLQLLYFKHSGGEWFIYSYQGQSFSWLHPHFKNYMFSFRTGWLLYNPIFILSLIGLYYTIKYKSYWVALVVFAIVNTYVVVCWDIWWYGGRAMVQSYPIFAFFIAAAIEKALKKTFVKFILFGFISICIYHNIWWTHNVHRGGLWDAYDMTKAYYYRVLGRWSAPADAIKLYDTNELFEGERKDITLICKNNFDNDTAVIKLGKLLNGSPADYVNGNRQYSTITEIPIKFGQAKWIRIRNTFLSQNKEWNFWLMTQVTVKFFNREEVIKENMYRPHRFLHDGQISDLYFDVKVPNTPFTKVKLLYWNAGGQNETLIDNIEVETYN